MDIMPLSWPKERGAKSKINSRVLSYFFKGLLLTQFLARKNVRKQLKERKEFDFDLAWGPNQKRIAIARDISSRLSAHCNWPNTHFIPTDPLCILLSESCQGLQSVCAMLDIQSHYKIDNNVMLHPECFTFGEFVDYLLNRDANG